MQKDHLGNIVHMDPDETIMYRQYRAHVAAGGGSRDSLPYTPQFDRLRNQFNNTTGSGLSENEFWVALTNLLKAGEEKIQDYLSSPGGSTGVTGS